MMICSLEKRDLVRYTCSQINLFFPDGKPVEEAVAERLIEPTLRRLDECFRGLANSYFWSGGDCRFNHLHSEQYAMYLYLLGNEAGRAGGGEGSDLAVKSYLLNKALHGLDLYFEVQLPPVFWLAHPVGTVLGRAVYGNGFAVMQGCTVGNRNERYPSFGSRVVMGSGSSVIGSCVIGNDVCIGAGAQLIDLEVPDGSTVVGRGNELRIIPKRSQLLDTVFRSPLSL